MSLFVSCGEASGDHYAGSLVKAIEGKLGRCWGMLGPEGVSAGGQALWDYNQLQIMGVMEALKSVPRLVRLKNWMTNKILEDMPSCVVVIDSPDYHIPLIKDLRRRGYSKPIFYVSPPTVWAWRKRRADVIRDLKVICLPLFELEHNFYRDRGVESHWLGHPLLDDLYDYVPSPDVLNMYEGRCVVALLPGSRSAEVRRLAPVLKEVGLCLLKAGYYPVFSIAESLSPASKEALKKTGNPLPCFVGSGVDLIYVSNFVIGACGTAAVEAMILEKFMLVLYKASLLSYIVYKLMVKTQWVSMPNVLLGREVYPELLQGKANASLIKESLQRYSQDTTRIRENLLEAKKKLGQRGSYKFWADVIVKRVEK